jgi:hypothetical protein
VLATLQGHSDTIRGMVAVQDQQHFLSGGEDGTLRCWGFGDIRRPSQAGLLRRRGKISHVLYCPGGQVTVLGEEGGVVSLWVGLGWRLVRQFRPFRSGAVEGMAGLEDGFLASSGDGRLGQFDWRSGEMLARFSTRVTVRSAVLLREAGLLAVGDGVGGLHLLRGREVVT